MEIRRYAIFCSVLVAILLGTYYLGYKAGTNNTKVEYVEKTVEVIKHVEVERGKIYSAPNIGRDSALRMLHNGEL